MHICTRAVKVRLFNWSMSVVHACLAAGSSGEEEENGPRDVRNRVVAKATAQDHAAQLVVGQTQGGQGRADEYEAVQIPARWKASAVTVF